MAGSLVRSMLKGWIQAFYIEPTFHFKFYGFSWIHVWPEWGMYTHFTVLVLLSLCIATGLFYRPAIILFFLGFTYLELMDVTYYLNHYYAILLLSFIMIFIPLNKRYSLDSLLNPGMASNSISRGYLWLLQFQIGIIYIFAGIAKLNYDWLVEAQPLTIWLKANTTQVLIGPYLGYPITAYIFSWAGMIFDLTVIFFMLNKKTRPYAYASILVFHFMTAQLFSIGVFPWVMMVITLVFFSPDWPKSLYYTLIKKPLPNYQPPPQPHKLSRFINLKIVLWGTYIVWQIAFPFRYVLSPGDIFWSEDGFRFSWRVMLMEKNGFIEFRVKSGAKEWVINPKNTLTPLQAKMMSTQPDLILQFAHYLKKEFQKEGHEKIEVYANSFVALNGRPSKRFINPTLNLVNESPGFLTNHKLLNQ